MKYYHFTFEYVEKLSPHQYEACLAFMYRHPIDSVLHTELVKSQAVQMAAAGAKDLKIAYSLFDSRYNMPQWLKEGTRFEMTEEEIDAEIEVLRRQMAPADMFDTI